MANSHTAPMSTGVSATFDQNINAATATQQTFVVHSMQRGELVGSAAAVSTAGATITLDPESDFFPGEIVQASVTSGIQGTAGQSADPRVWQLRTAVASGSGQFNDSGQTLGGHRTSDVAVGDLDGDGDLDVIDANWDTLADVRGSRVWLNDGSGLLTDSGQLLGDRSGHVLLGDVDGDGDLDVLLELVGGEHLWLNDGSGRFSDSGRRIGGSEGSVRAIGDLDADGDLDTFLGGGGDEANEQIWLNDGSGVFSDSGQRLGPQADFRGVELGDLDGDGDLDAFVFTGGNRTDGVWLNDGSGRFTDSGQILGDSNRFTSGVSLGDLDGDGDLDVFQVSRRRTSYGNVVGWNGVWLNNGRGEFSDSGQLLSSANVSSQSVSLGDLDGDGDLDAFVANSYFSDPEQPMRDRVWLNNGSGQFSGSGQALGNHASSSVALGDLDDDGDLDAIVGEQSCLRCPASTRLWLNQNAAAAVPNVTLSVDNTEIPEAVGMATLNATLSAASTQVVMVDLGYTGTATTGADYTYSSAQMFIAAGSLSGTVVITGVQDALDEPDETVIVDITGVTNGTEAGTQQVTFVITDDDEPPVPIPSVTSVDPLPISHDAPVSTDIVVAFDQTINADTATPLTFAVHSMQRGQFVGSMVDVNTLGATVTFSPNSDFLPGELVEASVTSAIQSTAGQAALPHVWQFRIASPLGSGVLAANEQYLGDEDGYFSDLALGDLDGDGDLDAFVAANGSSDANRVWLNSDGEFKDSELRLGDHDSMSVSLGDLDGDGDLDAFLTNRRQGNRVWFNTSGPYSGNLFADSGQSLGDHFSTASALGDVDGDGDLDAYVGNYDQPNHIWLNNGAGVFLDSGQNLGTYLSLDISLGDLDGDGDLDAFVANRDQSNRVWMNVSGSFIASGQSLGDHYSAAVSLGDLDGDGDLDAFVTNQSQGNRVWLNDAGSFSDSGQMLGDHDSRGVALGDLDSDGDLDAFVANNYEGNGLWLNNGGVFTDSQQSLGDHFSFGVALGDLDQDGDLDAVVANYYQDRVWLNQNPTFSVSPTRMPLAESDAGTSLFSFNVTREFDARGTATVDYTFSPNGNDPAEPADFFGTTLPNGTLTFDDGVSSLPVTIEVIGDTSVENDEGFRLTLSNPVGRNSVIGTSTAEAVIRNDDNVDLGDLPAPFPTLLAANGPAHVATGPTLGTARDTESDGQPTLGADGDNAGVATNDEDGVTFDSAIFSGQLDAEVTVNTSSGGLLDAWIDFDGDYSFDRAGEQILTSQSVSAGNNVLTFTVPAEARQGSTFARFRLSTAGGLAPTGGAPDGEVEDYTLTIRSPFGSASFVDSGQVLEPQDSTDVSLGDLDGDGDLDALVTNRNQSNTVWLNNDGIFADGGQLLGNHDSIDAAMGDVDGDGDLDAYVANRSQGNRVWLNDGGLLTDSGQSLGDHNSLGISLGDLDGDGDLDAFVANSGGQPDRVWLNEEGVFSDSGQLLGSGFSNQVALGDLDRDGDLDAFVVGGGEGNRVWLNHDGTFTDSGQSLGDHRSAAVSIGDLDGDGDLDAFVTNYEQGNRIWLNADGQFTDSGQGLGEFRSRTVAIGDLDGDGDLDAYVANVSDGNRVWLNEAGAFAESGQVLGDRTSTGVALGDVDRDGDLDAFVASYYQNHVWLNQNATLQVTSVTPTATGFVAEFNQDLDTAALNLYDTQTVSAGPSDVLLEGASSGAVAGSLIVDDSARKVTFIKTGAPLQSDNYTLTLRSAEDGFKTVYGGLLDGESRGIPAVDFVHSFTVAAPQADEIMIGIPDFVRGPGQEVNLPADTGVGIPVSISHGTNVRAIDLRISYDPALLQITSATVSAGMPAGASVILNNNTPGLAIVVFFSSASLPAGRSTFVNLQATIPATDPSGIYGRQQLLDVHTVTISDGNDNEFPVIADDAFQLVSYFADVSGNGRINASDASQVAKFAALLDAGFSASTLADPIIVGDVSGNGRVNAADASLLAQFAALLPVPEIPPIVVGAGIAGNNHGDPSAAWRETFGQLMPRQVVDDGNYRQSHTSTSRPVASSAWPISTLINGSGVIDAPVPGTVLEERGTESVADSTEQTSLTLDLEELIDEIFLGGGEWWLSGNASP